MVPIIDFFIVEPSVSLKNKDHNQIIKVLTKHYGFTVERQSGSHIQLKHNDGRRVTVPRHNPIKIGVIKINY